MVINYSRRIEAQTYKNMMMRNFVVTRQRLLDGCLLCEAKRTDMERHITTKQFPCYSISASRWKSMANKIKNACSSYKCARTNFRFTPWMYSPLLLHNF